MVLSAVLITVTLLPRLLATKAFSPLGLTATEIGPAPPMTVATTVPVAVSITEVLLLRLFVT